MAYNSFQNLKALEVVGQTEHAWSFDRYGRKQWFLIARFLISEGYTDEAVIQILRSKHMRWSADRGATHRGTYTKFRKYYFDQAFNGKHSIDRFLNKECKDLPKVYNEV